MSRNSYLALSLPQFRFVSIEGGGELTQFMTGKKERPRTEPMYSGGNCDDYPISSGYNSVTYTDFIASSIQNSQQILITQTIHNGRFSACFTTSKLYSPRPSCCWCIRPDYDTFAKFVEEKWEWVNGESFHIYSLACDEKFGFGVFLMKKIGTAQTILTGTSNIKKKNDEGFRITACAARGSSFYIIMTKGTKEYTGKAQRWFTRSTWKEISSELDRGYKEGKGITGICYSTGLGQYFVVMTEMPEGQSCKWFENTNEGHAARNDWMTKKREEGFSPSIIFNDPADDKFVIVMIHEKNRSGNFHLYNYPLK